jgi:hypothetical protein
VDTFQAVVRLLRFFAVMGEPVARRELAASWSGYGHDAAPESASGGRGARAASAVFAAAMIETNAVAATTAPPPIRRRIGRSD